MPKDGVYGDLYWNAEAATALFTGLKRNAKNASKHYMHAVRQAAKTRPIGSVNKDSSGKPLPSNFRRAEKYSSPGDMPYRQTKNLANSIRQRMIKSSDTIEYAVGSEAEYALTVEMGGSFQVDESDRKNTSWRLINPPKKPLNIAARPMWKPVFDRNKDQMIQIMASSFPWATRLISIFKI